MNKRKRRQLEIAYGRAPDREYTGWEMPQLSGFFSARAAEAYAVDDKTWQDLAMDEVFQSVNTAGSLSGEQMLYSALRAPAMDAADFEARRARVARMEQDGALRIRLQQVFGRLGKNKYIRMQDIGGPSGESGKRLALHILLVAALLACAAGLFLSPAFILPLLLLCAVNMIYHFVQTRRLEGRLPTANYAVALLSAARRALRCKGMDALPGIEKIRAAFERTRPIRRIGGVSFAMNSDFALLLNGLLLLDLIVYELLQRRLSAHAQDVLFLHEEIGKIDAAIAIASYRKRVSAANPDIDFSAEVQPFLRMENVRHPLLKEPVGNDLAAKRGLLLTGSNASGKSTFLKAVGVNVLLAQGIGAALCSSYAASSLRVYASLSARDDILSGESYFTAEIRALKRILDDCAGPGRTLALLDEVFRGTNTRERIAAAGAYLKALDPLPALGIAATHDIELCEILKDEWDMYYFTESIAGGDVTFDYRLRPGIARSSNAIRLMEMTGFAPDITASAKRLMDADMP